MNHVIDFRRPGETRSVTKISVPPLEDVVRYLRRLEQLGYKVIEVMPAVDQQGLPEKQETWPNNIVKMDRPES